MLFATVELGETVIVDDPRFFIPPPSKDAKFDTIVLSFLTVISEELATIPPPNPPDAGALARLPFTVHELMVAVSL
jgi:hypothetical protein